MDIETREKLDRIEELVLAALVAATQDNSLTRAVLILNRISPKKWGIETSDEPGKAARLTRW